MIVRPRPGAFGLLFTLQGSVVPAIAPRVLAVAAITTAVTLLHDLRPGLLPDLSAAPFTLLGLGLSIFLGFRNSACYDRWWEARKQCGTLLTEARSLARQGAALLPQAAQRRTAYLGVAYVHALAAWLRGADSAAAAQPWLAPEAERLQGRVDPPDAILRALTAEFAACLRRGEITDIVFATLEANVTGLCAIQAACERIRNTPIPFAYTLLLHRTAWLFCLLLPFALVGTAGHAAPLVATILAYAFFGLDALGDELEQPFAIRANTMPLDALARTIEIELREGLGETDLPAPLRPVNFVLQ